MNRRVWEAVLHLGGLKAGKPDRALNTQSALSSRWPMWEIAPRGDMVIAVSVEPRVRDMRVSQSVTKTKIDAMLD